MHIQLRLNQTDKKTIFLAVYVIFGVFKMITLVLRWLGQEQIGTFWWKPGDQKTCYNFWEFDADDENLL